MLDDSRDSVQLEATGGSSDKSSKLECDFLLWYKINMEIYYSHGALFSEFQKVTVKR